MIRSHAKPHPKNKQRLQRDPTFQRSLGSVLPGLARYLRPGGHPPAAVITCLVLSREWGNGLLGLL